MSSQLVRPFPVLASDAVLARVETSQTNHDGGKIHWRDSKVNQSSILIKHGSSKVRQVAALCHHVNVQAQHNIIPDTTYPIRFARHVERLTSELLEVFKEDSRKCRYVHCCFLGRALERYE